MAKEVDGSEVYLGSGKVYFAERVNDVLTGEDFLGDISTLEITPAISEIEKKSSATAARPVIASDVTDYSLTVRMTGGQFNKGNLARAFGGEIGSLVNGSGSVVDEAIANVEQGKYYPLTKRNVGTVVVTSDPAGTTYDVTDDYEVDAATGRIYIVPGGAIADGSEILVDFAYSAETKVTVKAGLKARSYGFLRFIGNNTRGKKFELQIWKLGLSSTGAVGFIQDQYGEFTLEGKIEADLSGHAAEPYFRLIEL